MRKKGYYFKDNDPVIGIQIENEYQYSVSDSNDAFATEGNEHMKILNHCLKWQVWLLLYTLHSNIGISARSVIYGYGQVIFYTTFRKFSDMQQYLAA